MEPLEKLQKIIQDADRKGHNIIICYDYEDGFWIGEKDRFLDPTPLEDKDTHSTLKAAIEAVDT